MDRKKQRGPARPPCSKWNMPLLSPPGRSPGVRVFFFCRDALDLPGGHQISGAAIKGLADAPNLGKRHGVQVLVGVPDHVHLHAHLLGQLQVSDIPLLHKAVHGVKRKVHPFIAIWGGKVTHRWPPQISVPSGSVNRISTWQPKAPAKARISFSVKFPRVITNEDPHVKKPPHKPKPAKRAVLRPYPSFPAPQRGLHASPTHLENAPHSPLRRL